MSDEADEAYSVTEQLTMTGINRIRQKINVHGIPVYLCEACGNPIPEARRKIFPGVTLCVECQAYWICPYISRHLLSLNPLQARSRRYSRGER